MAFYTVGTLSYDRRQLVVLFFWLMWNDFSIMLMEQIGGLGDLLMKNYGATYLQMSLVGSIADSSFRLSIHGSAPGRTGTAAGMDAGAHSCSLRLRSSRCS